MSHIPAHTRAMLATATLSLGGTLVGATLTAPAAAAEISHPNLVAAGLPELDSPTLPRPSLPSIPGIPDLGSIFGTTKANTTKNLDLSQTSNLTNGQTLKISGTGYAPGQKIYVTQTIAQPEQGYPDTYADAVKLTVDANGTFSTDLQVTKVFGDVDCTATQCYIASFSAFPNLADRSNDAWVPISFEGAAPATASSGGAASNGTSAGLGSSGANSAGPVGSAANGETSSATSTSGASVALSKSENLSPSNDTVQVSGKGFQTSGQGIYVGIAQQNQMSHTNADSFGPGTVYVSKSRGNLNADGSFSVDLSVSAKFGNADCLKNSCAIYTISAHGSSDRSQDTVSPVSFSGGVARAAANPVGGAEGAHQGSGAHGSGVQGTHRQESGNASGSQSGSGPSSSDRANGAVSVSLSTTELAANGTTPITVTGSGFKTTGNGIYVAVAEKSKFSTTNADVFSAATYIRTSQMSSSGGFTTTLDVNPATAAANCLENQCALYTFAAHGSADRSQDTVTDLTVAGGTSAAKEAAKQAEKEGKFEEKNEKSGKSKNKGTGSRSAKSTATGEAAPVTQDSDAQLAAAQQHMHPMAAGSIGAVIGAAILGAGLWLGRRSVKKGD